MAARRRRRADERDLEVGTGPAGPRTATVGGEAEHPLLRLQREAGNKATASLFDESDDLMSLLGRMSRYGVRSMQGVLGGAPKRIPVPGETGSYEREGDAEIVRTVVPEELRFRTLQAMTWFVKDGLMASLLTHYAEGTGTPVLLEADEVAKLAEHMVLLPTAVGSPLVGPLSELTARLQPGSESSMALSGRCPMQSDALGYSSAFIDGTVIGAIPPGASSPVYSFKGTMVAVDDWDFDVRGAGSHRPKAAENQVKIVTEMIPNGKPFRVASVPVEVELGFGHLDDGAAAPSWWTPGAKVGGEVAHGALSMAAMRWNAVPSGGSIATRREREPRP